MPNTPAEWGKGAGAMPKGMLRDPLQVRLSGRGGQGVILAGVVLAEAGMYDGLQVVHTQSYGPEARLGASKSEVILSQHPIAFPEVVLPDLLLCLSTDSYKQHGAKLALGGIRVVEERVQDELEVKDALLLPILRTAQELGSPISANLVALGALVALSQAVSQESLEKAIRARVKPALVAVNLKALEAGMRLAEARGKTTVRG